MLPPPAPLWSSGDVDALLMQVDGSVERAAATPLLFEFIVDASGRVLFVDAKSYPWPVAFGSFWEPDRPWLWRDMHSDESVPNVHRPMRAQAAGQGQPATVRVCP
jgi:hypothetical protein